MNDEQKPTEQTFSHLVRARLHDLRMSQTELGRRISKGPAYMSYLVRGTTNRLRGKKFRPSAAVVIEVARELGIPVDEALTASGYDPSMANAAAPPPALATAIGGPVPLARKPSPPSAPNKPDEALFDLAVKAAHEALLGYAAAGTTPAPTAGAKGITIDLADGAQVLLTGAGHLTAEEIEQLTKKFREGYELVRQTGQ